MLFYLAIYLLLGVILTMIAIEITDEKHKLTLPLLMWGALIMVPSCIYHLCKQIFGGNSK